MRLYAICFPLRPPLPSARLDQQEHIHDDGSSFNMKCKAKERRIMAAGQLLLHQCFLLSSTFSLLSLSLLPYVSSVYTLRLLPPLCRVRLDLPCATGRSYNLPPSPHVSSSPTPKSIARLLPHKSRFRFRVPNTVEPPHIHVIRGSRLLRISSHRRLVSFCSTDSTALYSTRS